MIVYEFNRGRNIFYKPEIKYDPMFMHCSRGMVEVTKIFFDETVLPLINMHGVDVEIVKKLLNIIKYKLGDDIWYKPVNVEDPIFKSCAENYIEAREWFFKETVEPALKEKNITYQILDTTYE